MTQPPSKYLERIEDVWTYPRPPRVEAVDAHVEIWFAGERIARTISAVRVLETSHPPTLYLPPDAFIARVLQPAGGITTICEWKGQAAYLDVAARGRVAARSAWQYLHPREGFEAIAGHVAVYPGRMDRCIIDGTAVTPQKGDFYGGWVTPNIHGKLKGGPGTRGW